MPVACYGSQVGRRAAAQVKVSRGDTVALMKSKVSCGLGVSACPGRVVRTDAPGSRCRSWKSPVHRPGRCNDGKPILNEALEA